ncbi:glycosyltransferase family 2 protein [Methanobrevibacter sp.]
MVAISVIIPVYNVGLYLRECLDSVVNQTFKDLEIICINDGSSDNSLEILKKYAKLDTRIKVISQENKGLSAARNVGMKYATGDYIYFLDSDDYLKLTMFEELYSIAREKSTDVIIFKLLNFENKSKFVVAKKYHEMSFLKQKVGDDIFDYVDIQEFLFDLDVTVASKFFKRDLIKDLEFYEGLIFEDNLFFVNYIFKAKRIYFYDKYLYHRRIRDDSITNSRGKNHVDIVKISNKIIDLMKELNYYEKFKVQLFNFKMYNIYIRFNNIAREYEDYFFDIIKNDFINHKTEYESIHTEKTRLKEFFRNVLNSDTVRELYLQMEIYEYECVMDEMEKSNQNLINDINSLKEKLNESREINNLIMSSNSWKYTEPFRYISSLFKK